MGRCGECQAWGSVAEGAVPRGRTAGRAVTSPAVPISQVPSEGSHARTSGVPELDRVLGGGIVPGAAVLLAGEPGVGKSTLLLEVAARTAASGLRTLYVTGEESASQVRLRADRTGGVHDELFLAAETDLGAVLGHVEAVRPHLLVVDSVQTIGAADVEGVPGGVTQVKEVAAALVRVAKTQDIATVLVGHVTKDGSDRRARGCSSTSSTWCCTSRASAAPGCGWSARSRTASARSTRSAASTCPARASWPSPTPPGCSWPGTTSRCRAPA